MKTAIDRQKMAEAIRHDLAFEDIGGEDADKMIEIIRDTSEEVGMAFVYVYRHALYKAGIELGENAAQDLYRLADLIDPTCEADYVGPDIRCTRCSGLLGYQIHQVPRYCPNCGARVVNDDQ